MPVRANAKEKQADALRAEKARKKFGRISKRVDAVEQVE